MRNNVSNVIQMGTRILDKSPHFQLAPNNLAPFIIRPIPNSPHTGSLL